MDLRALQGARQQLAWVAAAHHQVHLRPGGATPVTRHLLPLPSPYRPPVPPDQYVPWGGRLAGRFDGQLVRARVQQGGRADWTDEAIDQQVEGALSNLGVRGAVLGGYRGDGWLGTDNL